jgi:hypothetical protein
MSEHYIRLLTDIDLNDKQKHIWYKAVDKFLGAEFSPQPENFIDTLTSYREELEGDEDFPFVYVVYLNDNVNPELAEQIVYLWSEIYPKDFQIETSAEYDCECEDEIEIDDAMHEEIQRKASKFLHNRWVDDRISEGWRFALSKSEKDKTSPRLRDWDSLREDYRKEVILDRDQATDFFKNYPHLFV